MVATASGGSLPIVLENEFDNVAGQVNFAAGTLGPDFPSGTFDLVRVTFQAIAESTGTTIAFNDTSPRESDATYGAGSVLHHTEDGAVTVSTKAAVVGSVRLQGRPTAPDLSWSVPLTFTLYTPGQSSPAYEFTPTTDAYGVFTVTGIAPDSYEALVKNSHTLQNRAEFTLDIGPNPVDLGELREGDANDDNCVTLLDFTILATTFAKDESDPGFDHRADFNEDGWVSLLDFSLRAHSFGQCGDDLTGGGELPAPAVAGGKMGFGLPSSRRRAG